MASQTFLARDIFVGYWAVIIAAFVVDERSPVAPIQERLRVFVRRRLDRHRAFGEVVRSAGGFPVELLDEIELDAPWSETMVGWGEEVDLLNEVGLWLRREVTREELYGGHGPDLAEEVGRRAVRWLVGGVAGAQFSFGDRSKSLRAQVQEVLAALAATVPEGNPLRGVVAAGYEQWAEHALPEELTASGTHPAYRDWLRVQAGR